MSLYNGFNYLSNPMFVIKYDSTDQFVSYRGHAILSFYNQQEVKPESNFTIELLVAQPPNCNSELYVSELDSAGKFISTMLVTPDRLMKVKYEKLQSIKRDIVLLNIAKVHDTIRNFTIVDSLLIKVDKKGRVSELHDGL